MAKADTAVDALRKIFLELTAPVQRDLVIKLSMGNMMAYLKQKR